MKTINPKIQGSKGGGGSSHTPVEAPDSLHSLAMAQILDLISEGPIQGFTHGSANPLQDVYLNETPAQNPDLSFNFANLKFDSRAGTQSQNYMAGFPAVSNTTAVGVELKSTSPYSQSFTDLTLSAVSIILAVAQLEQTNTSNGDINGYSIQYAIDLKTDSGSYYTVLTSAFTGKTTSKYQRSHRIDLPAATSGWIIRVRRLTANLNSATTADVMTVDSYVTTIDAKFRYPNSAYVGLILDSSVFSSIPTRSYDMMGRIIQVPTNYDPIALTYATSGAGTTNGAWDGTFKPAWTKNPAWIYYDLATHPRYGLGNFVLPSMINKFYLYAIAQYCDGLVNDGFGGMEPRFTCTLYLQQQDDAFKVLQDLTSIFRGMAYWAGGTIMAVADMPQDPSYTYTNSNVIGGKFTYSGAASKTKFTVAQVSWTDPGDFGRTKVQYTEDPAGVARYGIQLTQTIAVGCTSQGQAERAGQWALLTSRLEGETVTFDAGLDGTICGPGQVIRILDAQRAGLRQSGRCRATTASSITTDAAPTVNVGDSLTVTLPTGITETHVVASVTGVAPYLTIGISGTFSSIPVYSSVWAIESSTLFAQTYRIIGIKDNTSTDSFAFTITALKHNASKFAAIDFGKPISIPPTSIVPLSSQVGPGAVNIESYATVNQVSTTSTITIYWGAALGAVNYIAEYRKDSGNWTTLPAQQGTSVDLANIPAGNYTARVTAINGSGIISLPVYSAVTLVADPSSLPSEIVGIQNQIALTNAQAAAINASLALIASDNNVSSAEKPTVIRDYSVIIAEQSGIDSEAVAYLGAGSSTQLAYDNSITFLTNYLATLTTPTSWNDKTGGTTVVGTTFRANFNTVFVTRQALLNAILTAGQAATSTAQVTANAAASAASNAQTSANNAQASASTAITGITAIASDNVLSSGEKGTVIQDYSVIVADQGGIDAQGALYGATTETNNYNSAITALTNYLATLTTPTAWNDVSGNTNINGPTFRAAFVLVYTDRQILLNKVALIAQGLVTVAQATGDAAANPVNNVIPNANFGQGLSGWIAGAGWAMSGDPAYLCPLFIVPSTGSTTSVLSSPSIPCTPGAIASASVGIFLNQSLIAGDVSADVQFYNASGGALGGSARCVVLSTANGKFTRYKAEGFAAPANTASMQMRFIVEGAQSPSSGQSAVWMRGAKIEFNATATPFNDAATLTGTTTSAINAGVSAANAAAAAATAQGTATQAENQLTRIASNNVLSAVNKPSVVLDYTNITNEESGILAQASAFAIAAPNYQAAITNLTNYLATLNSPTAWNDASGDTNIVSATFLANFANVYTYRQSTLNSISAQTLILANTAQSTANAGVANAANAQTAATAAQTTATLALIPGANLVYNPLFALAFVGWLPGAGWITTLNAFNQPAAAIGINSTATTSVTQSMAIPMAPGNTLSLACDAYLSATLTSGDCSCDVQFFDSTGSSISGSARLFRLSGATAGFQRFTLNGIGSPANTATAQVRVFVENAAGSAGFYVRRIKLEIGPACTPFNDDATQYGNK
jgi:predicted phage tail protein